MRLLVLSIDAMFTSNIGRLKARPMLAPVFSHCLECRAMRAIYPALTYPCHVSIVSGNTPAKHGVYQNLECVPNAKWKDWKWYYSDIRCRTLFDYFREAGWTSSAIFWPVSAQAPVDYLVPEIWSYTDDPVEIIKSTSGGKAAHIIERHREWVDFTSKYKLDVFAKNCAVDIAEEFDPDVMFLHFSLVDSTRHGYGATGPKVDDAFDQCADWLEEVLGHVKTPLEELSLVILGDHGHLNCRGSLSMNKLFAEKGWVSDPLPGTLSDCRAFCHAAGVSAQVYVNDPAICPEAEALFEKLKAGGWLYEWYTVEQTRAYGLDGPFQYVLEGGDGYYFVDAIKPDFFTPMPNKDGGEFGGKHGHWPLRGEKPPFLVCDRRLESRVLKDRSILDIAPTLCELFELPHDAMEGTSLLGK